MKTSDDNRRQFHRRFFKVEAEDARLYDLSINGARVSQDLAVRLIADVRVRAHASAGLVHARIAGVVLK